MNTRPLSLSVTALLSVALLHVSGAAHAEPTDPVVIGWWSYFDNDRIPTTSSPNHPVTSYGDADTYYYEPSGGKGMLEDPAVLAPATAWQKLVSYVLAKSASVSLAADFGIDTTSDLNQFTEARFGYAFVLLYVPKDEFCDDYKIHVGNVDDGIQATANQKILGYKTLYQSGTIDMTELGTNKVVLRPGLNEVVLIHEDQQATERMLQDVYLTHKGVKVPLAEKNIIYGRIVDSATSLPLADAKATITGNGLNEDFQTGPLGFYFFSGLQNGSYTVTASSAGHVEGTATVSVSIGAAASEAVKTDFQLQVGCQCPAGKVCGGSGACLDSCTAYGEFGDYCNDPDAVCVNGGCVKDACDTLTCKPGFRCEQGTCVAVACSNLCCGEDEVCSEGACVPNNCGVSCPKGETCAGGSCVDNCDLVTCVAGLLCQNGACIEQCKVDPTLCAVIAPDGSDPDSPDGGTGSKVRRRAGDCGCDVGGRPESSSVLASLVLFAAILASRLRRGRALFVLGLLLTGPLGCADSSNRRVDEQPDLGTLASFIVDMEAQTDLGGKVIPDGFVHLDCTTNDDCDNGKKCNTWTCNQTTHECEYTAKTCPDTGGPCANLVCSEQAGGACVADPIKEGQACSTANVPDGLCKVGECAPPPNCNLNDDALPLFCDFGGAGLKLSSNNPSDGKGATSSIGSYACAPTEAAPERSFTFSFPWETDVTVSLRPTQSDGSETTQDKDLDLIILQGACDPGASCVNTSLGGGAYAGITAGTGYERVTFHAKANVDYYLVVDGKASNTVSWFKLEIEACGPCQPTAATTLHCAMSMPLAGDTASGQSKLTSYTCGGGVGDVTAAGKEQPFFFRTESSTTQNVKVTVSGASGAARLLALPVNDYAYCDPTACLGASAETTNPTLTFSAWTSGFYPASYWVVVDTSATDVTYGLSIECL